MEKGKLHIFSDTVDCGEIGIETNIKTSFGTRLFVGDQVLVIDNEHTYNSHLTAVFNRNGFFIMGIKDWQRANEELKNQWTILKEKSFSEVIEGEKITSFKISYRYVNDKNN